MHYLQGLECGEITPRPGALHPYRIVEKVARKSQMEVIGAQSMIWQRLNRGPEVPERKVILVGDLRDCGIDAVVTFQVVRFSGDDRHSARFENTLDNPAHVLIVFLFG